MFCVFLISQQRFSLFFFFPFYFPGISAPPEGERIPGFEAQEERNEIPRISSLERGFFGFFLAVFALSEPGIAQIREKSGIQGIPPSGMVSLEPGMT